MMFRHFALLILLVLSITLPACAAENAAETISWKTSWNEAAKAAKESSKNILLLFTNPERCPPCRMMEQQTWPDAGVAKFVNANFVPLMIHTGRSKERGLANEFMMRGIPTTLVVDTDKNVVASKVGFSPPEEFLKFLRAAASVEKLQKKVKTDADNVTHVFELASVYVKLGRKADAVGLLEKICKLDNDNSKEKKVHALYLLGTIALENKQIEDAKKKFHEVMKLDPKDKTAYADDIALQLAILPANEGNFASAASNLKKFMADFPKSKLRPEAFLYLGRCYTLAGDKDAGAKVFKKFIKEYPDSRHAEYAKRFLQDVKRTTGKSR